MAVSWDGPVSQLRGHDVHDMGERHREHNVALVHIRHGLHTWASSTPPPLAVRSNTTGITQGHTSTGRHSTHTAASQTFATTSVRRTRAHVLEPAQRHTVGDTCKAAVVQCASTKHARRQRLRHAMVSVQSAAAPPIEANHSRNGANSLSASTVSDATTPVATQHAHATRSTARASVDRRACAALRMTHARTRTAIAVDSHGLAPAPYSHAHHS